MHKLLLRQLKRCLPRADAEVPNPWRAFVAAVNEAYEQADADRRLVERSLELTSQELIQRYNALRVSEERFELVARATNDAVWDWDLLTNAVWWNSAVQDLFHYAPEEIGPDVEWWSERIHPQDRKRVLASLQAVIQRGRHFWSDEYRFCRRDGSYADIFDRGYVVHDEAGKPVRMIGAMMDITGRKDVERLKDEFLSTVSHELRTPLATIQQFIAILADRLAGPTTAQQQEYLTIIQSNVARLTRFINELLDLSKIEAGHLVLTRTLLEVKPLLAAVLESLQPLAGNRRVTLTSQAPEGLPLLFADADKLTHVLINLVGNAMKFTVGPGRVVIAVEDLPHEMQFKVTDTGVGIAPEDMPKLFEKFQQFTQTAGPEGPKGTGLGLAISKHLVELHGGRIWATSTPGQGSMFAFTVPKYEIEELVLARCEDVLTQAKRTQSDCSLLSVSLKNFSILKARYGPEQISRLLKTMELRLREIIRGRDEEILVRWQRGELLLLLPKVDPTGARTIAQRLLQYLVETSYQVRGQTVTLMVQVATATYPVEAQTSRELLDRLEQQRPQEAPPTRLLVVDDEPKIRQFLKEVLELREYAVTTAASGPEALALVKRQPIDCILLDLMMPVMDGYELYHLLKEDPATAPIPVLIVTAKGERKDRELGLPASAPYTYVTKPFQLEELVAKLQEVLQRQAQTPTAPPKEVAHGPPEEDPHRG